jgi:ubiquinone/menaquinone biosynthesis C-methylase UbiE
LTKDIHNFAGRGSDRALTEFINRKIFDELGIQSSDRLVDIGCGDGLLLRLAMQSGVKTAIGLSGTEKEAHGLREIGLDVKQAFTDSLPLPDKLASVIVCNSVLLLVPENKMAESLREIARIASPDARVWLGEIPRVPEPCDVPRHETIPEMLWWMLRKRGLRSFVGMCRRLLAGSQRGPILVNKEEAVFHAPPETFIHMASEAGLTVERHFPHQTLDNRQQARLSPTRHDYLFRKAG